MINLFKKKGNSYESNNSNEPTKNVIQDTKKTSFEKDVYDADHGNYYVAIHVGISYHYGIEKGNDEHPEGLEPNLRLAKKYLTLAAERGFLRAQVDLGLLYYDSDSELFDREAGFKWLSLAAKRGDAFSQYVLAIHYRNGEYLQKDENKAYHWFLEAASNGFEGAMYELGLIYQQRASELLKDENFSEDDRKRSWQNAQLSFKWYKKSADLGNSDSMFYVGVFYDAGYGVENNYEQALLYIDKAIENGCEAAADFKRTHFSEVQN